MANIWLCPKMGYLQVPWYPMVHHHFFFSFGQIWRIMMYHGISMMDISYVPCVPYPMVHHHIPVVETTQLSCHRRVIFTNASSWGPARLSQTPYQINCYSIILFRLRCTVLQSKKLPKSTHGSIYQWVDLRENLLETIDFPMKYGFSCDFSLKPINWI